jgi:hypothetical protein
LVEVLPPERAAGLEARDSTGSAAVADAFAAFAAVFFTGLAAGFALALAFDFALAAGVFAFFAGLSSVFYAPLRFLPARTLAASSAASFCAAAS